jgi:hypothetical protein
MPWRAPVCLLLNVCINTGAPDFTEMTDEEQDWLGELGFSEEVCTIYTTLPA